MEGRFGRLILDAMLPGMDGMEICRMMRERGFDGAILTARGEGYRFVRE